MDRRWWLGEGDVHCHDCHVYLFFLMGVSLPVRCPDFPNWSLRPLSLSWHQPQPMLSLFLPSLCPLHLLYANSQK